MLRYGRKLAVGVVGGGITLAGLVMLVLPGPAVIVIPMGLAVLALEFAWARRAERRMRREAQRALAKARARSRRRRAAVRPRVDRPPQRLLGPRVDRPLAAAGHHRGEAAGPARPASPGPWTTARRT